MSWARIRNEFAWKILAQRFEWMWKAELQSRCGQCVITTRRRIDKNTMRSALLMLALPSIHFYCIAAQEIGLEVGRREAHYYSARTAHACSVNPFIAYHSYKCYLKIHFVSNGKHCCHFKSQMVNAVQGSISCLFWIIWYSEVHSVETPSFLMLTQVVQNYHCDKSEVGKLIYAVNPCTVCEE
jgi:hypothetical protein